MKKDMILYLCNELEDLRIKHVAMTEDLHHMWAQYESAVESKTELVLEERRKGTLIKKFQGEVKSAITSDKKSKEYEEANVISFMDGFWQVSYQAQAYYPWYNLDFGKFALPEDVSMALTRIKE